ncbi:MAG: hypothetical protein DI570_15300 [Phenylobacterium zucineum]|nr:MAG: hypothetical protein DI570_15300 [Phenylobacterium zucineum]
MKHAVLTSIGHNISDSLASGIGLMIGVYEMDVFGEARRSPDGFIEVDFLTGVTSGAQPTPALAEAIRSYAQVLPSLCERQGASVTDFKRLVARFQHSGSPSSPEFIVEVEDRAGKVSRDRYLGVPGRRPRVLDPLGRMRRNRSA